MKFNLSDFLQLDTKGLLAVNGGYNCNGSSSESNTSDSSGNGGGNSNSNSTTTVYVPTSSFTGYMVTKHSKGNGFNDSNVHGSSSGSSGGGSCSTPSSSPDSSSGKSNNPDGQGPSTTSSNPGKNSGDKGKKDDTPQGGGTCPGKDIGKTSYEKILEQIIAKGDKTGIEDQFDPGEKKGCYVKGSYQCDEYVEEMIRKAGFKPKDYSIDNPSGKTINDHIKDLQASKKNYETDASKLTKGAYVVFMSDKEETLESHAALLFVEEGGGAFMYDNSSHNFKYKDSDGKTAYYGGIERTNGNSAKAVCNQYVGYENFYFQQL